MMKTVRYYCISDNYKTVVMTPNMDEYIQALNAFLVTLKESKKQNNYVIFTSDLEKKDFEVMEKNNDLMKRRRESGMSLV